MARWGSEEADAERTEGAPIRAHMEPGQVPTDGADVTRACLCGSHLPEHSRSMPAPASFLQTSKTTTAGHLSLGWPWCRRCLHCSARLHMGHEYLKTSAKPSHKRERALCGFCAPPPPPFPTSYSLQETRESLTIYSDFILFLLLFC